MSNNCELCALVARPQDAAVMRQAGATRVYLDVIDLEPTSVLLELLEREGLVPVLDEVCRESDRERVGAWIRPGLPVAVGNLSELSLARERGAVVETRGCIPVHNVATTRVLSQLGASFAWLSPEASATEIVELVGLSHLPLGVVAYGRPRLMTCEHCALQVAYSCEHDHECCPHRQREHWLVNIDDRHLPVRTDVRGRSRVYLDEPIDLTDRALALADAGVSRLLVDASTTSVEEAMAALKCLSAVLAGDESSVEVPRFEGLSATGVE